MGRRASHQINKPRPSPRFRDTVRLHQYRRSKPSSLGTRDFDEACEVARDKFTLAANGHGVQSVLRAYKTQEAGQGG
ncbi:MAG: hypothetical protein WA864_16445 [Acetobacteraceae bacterium]|jgi:hypothetical protein